MQNQSTPENESGTKESSLKSRQCNKSAPSLYQDLLSDLDPLKDLNGQRLRGHANVHWSVPWSDLMMVMFVFFAILFYCKTAESEIEEKKVPEQSVVTTEVYDTPFVTEPAFGFVSPQTIYQSSQQVIKEANLDNVEVILQDDQSVKVSVQGPMLFDLGKAELKVETASFLDSIAGVIKQNNYEIQIVGHTDDYPVSTMDFPSNWELSAMRATKVARYLIEQGGIEPGRFSVIGHSKYRPKLPNISNDNKALNRRVEIIITRKEYSG